jgi:glycogen(starch) synthase
LIYGGLGTAIGGLVRASAFAGMTQGVLLVGGGGRAGYDPRPLDQMPAAPAEVSDPGRSVKVFPVSYAEAKEAAVQVVREWRPDVIHLHVFWLWHAAQAIQERTGIPLIYTVHSLDRAEYELGDGPSECLHQWGTQEAVIDAADRIVALTQSERELLAEYCPAARERVRIVGNGIEDSALARQAAERPCGGTAPLVLYTGRFVERKGLRELLHALPAILDRAPGTRFVLAGGHRQCSGTEMEQHWLPAAAQPYRNRIQFTGWLSPEEISAWYSRADILVVPSWYEPFGMVILEGMLYGLPVAAAAVGGPMEILTHRQTGLLFAPRDAGALADALLTLIENPPLRHELSRAGAREVRQRWLWPALVEKMRGVYQEAVARHGWSHTRRSYPHRKWSPAGGKAEES